MIVKILAFGIAADIAGSRSFTLDLPDNATVLDLKSHLRAVFPPLGTLTSVLIAVNEDYGNDSLVLKETDDIAIIPPVSGG